MASRNFNGESAGNVSPQESSLRLCDGEHGWTFAGFWYFLLFTCCLALPNLIYSGEKFFQTLHLMKWAFSLVPVALMALTWGGEALVKGKGSPLRIDFFGTAWLLCLIPVSAQPLWTPLRSATAWLREWFFFAGCVVFYLTAFANFEERSLRPILKMAALNATINGVFAEMQIRGFTPPVFGLNIIMRTPGHYIGNTGQQNMFALWTALALFSSLFLFVLGGENSSARGMKNRLLHLGSLSFYTAMSWFLLRSTSRSGIIAFCVGTAALTLMIFVTDRDRGQLKRIGLGAAIFLFALGVFIFTDTARGAYFLRKAGDMVENVRNIAKRREIWESSWQVFRQHPLAGVGLGQFKWHYLLGQRAAMELNPRLRWQFTYWAHNEILQCFCEFGISGGFVLLFLGAVWTAAFFRCVRRHSGRALPPEFLWGASVVFLFCFDALWTRPFHRIENALWATLAFALCNRHLFRGEDAVLPVHGLPSAFYRLAAAFTLATAALGLWYGIDGVRSDMLLRRAASIAGDVTEKERLLRIAENSPMVRDHAQRELALLHIRTGERSGDRRMLADGLNELIAVFASQPTAKDYAMLLEHARRSNITSLLEFLEQYSPPPRAFDRPDSGTVSHERRGLRLSHDPARPVTNGMTR